LFAPQQYSVALVVSAQLLVLPATTDANDSPVNSAEATEGMRSTAKMVATANAAAPQRVNPDRSVPVPTDRIILQFNSRIRHYFRWKFGNIPVFFAIFIQRPAPRA
jgi:hypothetical protein